MFITFSNESLPLQNLHEGPRQGRSVRALSAPMAHCSARDRACRPKKQRTDQSPLISWAFEHGVELSGVAIRGSQSGVGFFATERLDAGRQVVFVPDALVLSAQLAAESPIGKEVSNAGFNVICSNLGAPRKQWICALGGTAEAAGVENAKSSFPDNSITRRSVLYALLIYLRYVHKPGKSPLSELDKFVPFAHSLADDMPSVFISLSHQCTSACALPGARSSVRISMCACMHAVCTCVFACRRACILAEEACGRF